MKKITLHDTRKGVYVEAYTDFYIYEYQVGYVHDVYAISVAGWDSAVKAVTSAMIKKTDFHIDKYSYESYKMVGDSKSFRRFTAKTADFVHSIVYNDDGNTIIAWDGNIIEALFRYLQKFTVPFKKEWTELIFNELKKRYAVKELNVYSEGRYVVAYRAYIDDDILEQVVTELVRNRSVKFGQGTENAVMGVSSMEEYLLKYGSALAEKVAKENQPLHMPGKDPLSPLFVNFTRKPLRAQGDVIQAIAKTLERQNYGIISGEMGTGKTLIGSCIPYIHSEGRPYRALVMCPGHLVKKWAREIKKTIPGAKTFILENYTDVVHLKKGSTNSIEYYIISRDRAKLSYFTKPAVTYNERRGGWICPDCGALQVKDISGDDTPLGIDAFNSHYSSNHKCCKCSTVLWEADNSKVRRYAPAEYIKRHLKGFFDYLIADEVHEYKGVTGQGNAFGALASACDKTLAMTGTLLGGYASNLFYILFRLNPGKLIKDGLDYHKITRWIERYGLLETKYKEKDDELNSSSKGSKRRKVSVREIPGISPLVFSKYLLESCAFINLEDIAENLPPYMEVVESIKMDKALEGAYNKLQNKILQAVRKSFSAGKRLLGTYLNTLLAYPDKPYENEPVIDPLNGDIIAVPEELNPGCIYPKEKRLIEVIKKELSHKRRVFVYVQYTGKRDMTKRLVQILKGAGIYAEVLKSTIKPENREEWISCKVREGAKVIEANPKLVETGLDLLDFPTYIFYQTGYNLFTLRQASRRGWRIGQKLPVKVIFMAYEGTLQEKALALMGSKLKAALAIEGKFSEEGLRSLAGSDNDMLSELAKALTGGLSNVESAESVWASFAKIDADAFNDNLDLDSQEDKAPFEQSGQISLDQFVKVRVIRREDFAKRKARNIVDGQLALDIF